MKPYSPLYNTPSPLRIQGGALTQFYFFFCLAFSLFVPLSPRCRHLRIHPEAYPSSSYGSQKKKKRRPKKARGEILPYRECSEPGWFITLVGRIREGGREGGNVASISETTPTNGQVFFACVTYVQKYRIAFEPNQRLLLNRHCKMILGRTGGRGG